MKERERLQKSQRTQSEHRAPLRLLHILAMASTTTAAAGGEPKRKAAPEDAGPSWKTQLAMVGALFAAVLATQSVTSSIERFEYISSYPSRFTVAGLPNDLLELATWAAPAPVSLLVKGAGERFLNLVDPSVRSLPLDKFITKEEAYAWDRLLENVHPPGTAKGCVVASPSRHEPNYW